MEKKRTTYIYIFPSKNLYLYFAILLVSLKYINMICWFIIIWNSQTQFIIYEL